MKQSLLLSFAPGLGALILCACKLYDDGLLDEESTGGTTSTTGATTTEPEPTGGDTEAEGSGSGGAPMTCAELEPRAMAILETNCSKCHGPGNGAQGGIDYILDPEELIASGKAIPGDPDNSRIYVRMTNVDAPMPPNSEAQRPSADDIAVIREWIDGCLGDPQCEPGEPGQPDHRVELDEVLTAIAHDLDGASVSVDSFPFTRYLSLVHLANAGMCDSEIEVHRQALTKLVNSLSQAPQIRPPVAIDERELIFRIDLRDYGWQATGNPVRLSEPSFYFRDGDRFNLSEAEMLEMAKLFADKWEMIADQNPYSVSHIGEQAGLIHDLTQTRFPILQADAFVDVTTRAPLYYDILDIPLRSGRLRADDPPCAGDECLETMLGLDFLGDIADELATDTNATSRAGVRESDISDFNRIIERHEFANAENRTMWITHDFAGQNGPQNIFLHPLDFDADVDMFLFSLPNGLQAYMLSDAEGRRLEEAPVNILRDPQQKDFISRGAISCIGCHSTGLIRAQDDLRFELDEGLNEVMYDAVTRDQIRALHPPRAEFEQLQDQDIARFGAALEQCGLDKQPVVEPVSASFLAFDEDLALARAAAELGLTAEDLQLLIGKLNPDLLDLGKGETVQRQDFTVNFAESVCLLHLGRTRCCPDDPDDITPACDP